MISSSTRSKASARSFSRASMPFSASPTVWPCCFSPKLSLRRFVRWSSTTKMCPCSPVILCSSLVFTISNGHQRRFHAHVFVLHLRHEGCCPIQRTGFAHLFQLFG